jgi:hypothetical protein
MQTQTITPREDEHTWDTAPYNSQDDINTSQEAQEETILWLSRVPLNPPESNALVSTLALTSSSRLYGGSQGPVIALAKLILEASLREGVGQEQTNTAIDCVLVLGNIKSQSTVDRSSDYDHDIGEIPVPPSISWPAQQLTTNVFQPGFATPQPGWNREQLLTATA